MAKTAYIELRTGYATSNGTYGAGDVVEVPAADAKRMIDKGYAVTAETTEEKRG